jgi:hypothetical protein
VCHPALEVADIFRDHGPAWRSANAGHISPRPVEGDVGHRDENVRAVLAACDMAAERGPYGNARANFAGWFFLTRSPSAIAEVRRRYGVFAAKVEDGNVDHTFLTSIIDRRGILRVQYLGVRFDPEEFRLDLLSLVNE